MCGRQAAGAWGSYIEIHVFATAPSPVLARRSAACRPLTALHCTACSLLCQYHEISPVTGGERRAESCLCDREPVSPRASLCDEASFHFLHVVVVNNAPPPPPRSYGARHTPPRWPQEQLASRNTFAPGIRDHRNLVAVSGTVEANLKSLNVCSKLNFFCEDVYSYWGKPFIRIR